MKKQSKIANNINNLIKRSGLSINEVVARSGYTRDNVSRIRKGIIKLNEENMQKMAFALNCYPSELLPLEWQKPAEIIESRLEEAIKYAFKVNQELPQSEKLTGEQNLHLVINHYKNHIKITS